MTDFDKSLESFKFDEDNFNHEKIKIDNYSFFVKSAKLINNISKINDNIPKINNNISRINDNIPKINDNNISRINDIPEAIPILVLKIPKTKQIIPKHVKTIIWNHYIGDDIIKHRCLCCKKVLIKITDFHVGHVISEKEGGTHEINNLRPICGACNHSMGTTNMIDFIKTYGLYI